MPTFHELLVSLAAEHTRVLDENSSLAGEVRRLRSSDLGLGSICSSSMPGKVEGPQSMPLATRFRILTGATAFAKDQDTVHSPSGRVDLDTSIPVANLQQSSGQDSAPVVGESSFAFGFEWSKRFKRSLAAVDMLMAPKVPLNEASEQLPKSNSSGLSIRPMRSSALKILSESQWVINPEQSFFLRRWDTVTVTALVFVALVTPVQVSMVETRVDLMFLVSCMVDLIFVIDMGLQFFLMYPKQTNYGYVLENQHSMVVQHYLKSWFSIDFISVVPFEQVGILARLPGMQQMKIVKVIRLLRLLKLVRVLRVSRILHRLESHMPITYGQLGLIKFFSLLALLTHWLANLWALTLVLVDENDGVPRWIESITEKEQNVADKTKDTPWKLYITCLYFTSYTLTSVGYGDISPQNIEEIVICMMIVVISGVSWAVVLGQVCGIVANLDPDEEAFRRTMDDLKSMMKDRVMPEGLRMRLRSFFRANKRAQHRARHHHLIANMSPGLQGEVVMEINRMWIEKVRLLKVLLEDPTASLRLRFHAFVVDVSQKMQLAIHAQSEVFGEPHVLYILKRGLVSRGIKLHHLGSVWGVDFLLSKRKLIEPFASIALTYVELTSLQRDVFFELVESRTGSCPELKQKVRKYCGWLAFQRAIRLEARRRMRKQRDALRASHAAQRSSGNDVVSVVASAQEVEGAPERDRDTDEEWDPGQISSTTL